MREVPLSCMDQTLVYVVSVILAFFMDSTTTMTATTTTTILIARTNGIVPSEHNILNCLETALWLTSYIDAENSQCKVVEGASQTGSSCQISIFMYCSGKPHCDFLFTWLDVALLAWLFLAYSCTFCSHELQLLWGLEGKVIYYLGGCFTSKKANATSKIKSASHANWILKRHLYILHAISCAAFETS